MSEIITKSGGKAMMKMLAEDPVLIKEWDFEKNDKMGLKPEGLTVDSRHNVWWKCKKGHSWRSTIFSRKHGYGCPLCVKRKLIPGHNDLVTVAPELAMEWDYEGNGDLRPEDFLASSRKIVKWRCRSGHQYEAKIFDRSRCGHGCPYDSVKMRLPMESGDA